MSHLDATKWEGRDVLVTTVGCNNGATVFEFEAVSVAGLFTLPKVPDLTAVIGHGPKCRAALGDVKLDRSSSDSWWVLFDEHFPENPFIFKIIVKTGSSTDAILRLYYGISS